MWGGRLVERVDLPHFFLWALCGFTCKPLFPLRIRPSATQLSMGCSQVVLVSVQLHYLGPADLGSSQGGQGERPVLPCAGFSAGASVS